MKKSVWKAIKRGDRIRRDLPRKKRPRVDIRTVNAAMKDCNVDGVVVNVWRKPKYLHAAARRRLTP